MDGLRWTLSFELRIQYSRTVLSRIKRRICICELERYTMSQKSFSIKSDSGTEELFPQFRHNQRSLVGLEALVPVINKLRDVFQKTGSGSFAIQLPQIVVVGSQSAGKTTVLESLVGKNFLPRGNGIQTRCPIVLNLINTPDDEGEYCMFEHKPDQRFTFDGVEKEIREQTTTLAGRNHEITDKIIQLNVFSPNVLTLTVVDLPGLVKVPTGGQPDDIEDQVKKLVVEYIAQPNAIILAVSPGNADIATSESIKLAKEVDQPQERTIAVITKLDLGEDITEVLSGRTYPMKMGIIGVLNRSQKEIEAGVTFEEGLEKEHKFLKQRYPAIAQFHGTEYLKLRLNNILMQHIQKCCPSLDIKVRQLLSEKREALISLGNGHNMSQAEKMEEMIRMLTNFTGAFKGQTDGQGRTQLVADTLTGGARIDEILKITLAVDLALLDPLANISDLEIIIAVRNSIGIGMRLAQPELALYHVIQREVAKMKPVVIHCAFQVHLILKDMINACTDSSHRFRRINAGISHVVNELLDANLNETRDILIKYIDVQASSGLTYDEAYHTELRNFMEDANMVDLGDIPPAFILNGQNDAILSLSNGQSLRLDERSTLSESQKSVCNSVRKLLQSYFTIVRKQVQDHVPKTLLHFLVRLTVDEMAVRLSTVLCTPEKVDELVREPGSITQQREILLREVESLDDAAKVLDSVREITMVDQ